jgi:hypothetical protein
VENVTVGDEYSHCCGTFDFLKRPKEKEVEEEPS